MTSKEEDLRALLHAKMFSIAEEVAKLDSDAEFLFAVQSPLAGGMLLGGTMGYANRVQTVTLLLREITLPSKTKDMVN